MKKSVIFARYILIVCVVGAMGMVNEMFEGSFLRGLIVIVILAIIFMLFWKKAYLLKSIEKEDPKII